MSFYQEIRERRVLPAVGVYIGACWVLVEILDRLTERYYLSPYLTDIVFWGLYSLIPAVLLLAWTHGRPGKDKTSRAEKVGIPVNLVLTVGLLLAMFGGKDLSATAELVTVSNELGQQEERYVPRETYRRRLAVFFLGREGEIPADPFLPYGATALLAQDLGQNPFMVVSTPWDNREHGYYSRMEQSGYRDGLGVPLSLLREIAARANRPYFVEGSVRSDGGGTELTVSLWETDTLREVGTYRGEGSDLLTLVDEASEQVRAWLDVPSGKGAFGGDLPLSETFGSSSEALKHYVDGLNAQLFDNDWDSSLRAFEAALAADPNFVLAGIHRALAQWELGDVASTQQSLAEARRLDYRLSERDQMRLRAYTYRISGETDKLEKLLRMQIELTGDVTYVRGLARLLMLTGRLEESKTHYRRAMEQDSSDLASLLALARLEQSTGRPEQAIEYARRYIQARPEDLAGNLLLGDLLTHAGRPAEARLQFEKAQLLDDPPVEPTLRLVGLAAREGEWSEARALLAEARAMGVSALHASQVLASEVAVEVRLGRIERAIELIEDLFEYNRQVLPPVEQVFSYFVPISQFSMMLGRLDQAESVLQEAQASIQPPLNQFLSFIEVVLRARQGDFVAAEAALQQGVDALERFKADYLSFQISISGAEIARAHGDHAQAAALYAEAIERARRSPVDLGVAGELTSLYGESAQQYVKAGDLVAARVLLDRAFERDEGEPSLWVARAMLQRASGNPAMALASINYALAIWRDADPDYVAYQEALALRDELTAPSR